MAAINGGDPNHVSKSWDDPPSINHYTNHLHLPKLQPWSITWSNATSLNATFFAREIRVALLYQGILYTHLLVWWVGGGWTTLRHAWRPSWSWNVCSRRRSKNRPALKHRRKRRRCGFPVGWVFGIRGRKTHGFLFLEWKQQEGRGIGML